MIVKRQWRGLFAGLLILALASSASAGELFGDDFRAFAGQIDTVALSRLPIQYNGRTTIFDTFAREQLQQITGDDRLDGVAPAVAYLELYFNAGRYLYAPVIYVHEKKMRWALQKRLSGKPLANFERTDRLAPVLLLDPTAYGLLLAAGRVDQADLADLPPHPPLREPLGRLGIRQQYRLDLERLNRRYSSFMAVDALRLIPAEGQWLSIDATKSFETSLFAYGLGDAWRQRQVDGVNTMIGAFAARQQSLAETAGVALPSPQRCRIELIYNRTYHATVVWVGFAVTVPVLILALVAGRQWMRRLGLTLLMLAALALWAGFAVRWILSGQTWYLPPLRSQFEAVTASAMLGATIAVVLELFWKRTYIALAAAIYATAALLAGFFLPVSMSGHLSAAPGILDSPIMAAHVALIIVGHAMAGMTLIISVFYVIGATFGNLSADASSPPDLSRTMPATRLAAIDRGNLIIAQLACWLIILGTALGAYWADFAWGRWWGWDRKETWALITAVIFLLILHLRYLVAPRSRGAVTAILCIIAAAAMLFNWIVVNYLLPGLHSYA